MLSDSEKKQLMGNLARLGGKGWKEEDIVYEGTKLVIPAKWQSDPKQALKYLTTYVQGEEEEATFTRKFNYRPWDGAINAFHIMRATFGFVKGEAIETMFGKIPPAFIQVPISATETEEVPWGDFSIPFLDKTRFNFHATSSDLGVIFEVTVTSPRKNRFAIEGIFQLIEEELKNNSIYRGKAFDNEAKFLDLKGVSREKVVYSGTVEADLQAHVWAPIMYSQKHRDLGLSLKRSVLMYGPYGTGKSMSASLTAQICEANGWSFVLARPGADFRDVMNTARMYQPCVVFMEDAETIAAAGDADQISEVLDIFDGISAKGTELMVILTTNHPDQIHRGMMRPGRLDAVIEISELDDAGIEKLLRAAIPANMLETDIDFSTVVGAYKGYMPAFIKEAADRAIRYTISRGEGEVNTLISAVDLVAAAEGLRPQFNRMMDAPEAAEKTPLTVAFEQTVKRAIADLTPEGSYAHERVWDAGKLAAAQSFEQN